MMLNYVPLDHEQQIVDIHPHLIKQFESKKMAIKDKKSLSLIKIKKR
jgi:hypothetical protein